MALFHYHHFVTGLPQYHAFWPAKHHIVPLTSFQVMMWRSFPWSTASVNPFVHPSSDFVISTSYSSSISSWNTPLPIRTLSLYTSLPPSCWVREDSNPLLSSHSPLPKFPKQATPYRLPDQTFGQEDRTTKYTPLPSSKSSFLGKDDNVQRPLHHVPSVVSLWPVPT